MSNAARRLVSTRWPSHTLGANDRMKTHVLQEVSDRAKPFNHVVSTRSALNLAATGLDDRALGFAFQAPAL